MEARRSHERRLVDATFFFIERRDRGNAWRYGSVAVAVLLLIVAGWLDFR